jgi:hypothetical protein
MPEEKRVSENFNADKFKAYEDGKHRRYNLLFAVNGGAFAVAKLFTDPKLLCDGNLPPILGGLSLGRLSFGMILFTALMTLDIYMFGHKMRKLMLEGKRNVSMWQETFSLPGKAVLIAIGSLICIGWFLVDGL